MYEKQVAWKYPFDNQYLPLGKYGIAYTKVVLDIPKIYSVRYMEYSNTFIGSESNENSIITLHTSIPYHRYTLKVFADGIEVPMEEESAVMVKESFDIRVGNISGKYVYVSYIPGNINYFIGDRTDYLTNNFGVITSVDYNNQLREIINSSRTYIDGINKILKIPPMLWIGGFGNRDIENVQPGITPTDVSLHLETIRIACELIAKTIISYGYTNILLPESVSEYTVKFMESIQRTLSEADEAIYNLVENGKIEHESSD